MLYRGPDYTYELATIEQVASDPATAHTAQVQATLAVAERLGLVIAALENIAKELGNLE